MKKIFSILLSVFLIFTNITSCKQTKQETKNNTNTTSIQSENEYFARPDRIVVSYSGETKTTDLDNSSALEFFNKINKYAYKKVGGCKGVVRQNEVDNRYSKVNYVKFEYDNPKHNKKIIAKTGYEFISKNYSVIYFDFDGAGIKPHKTHIFFSAPSGDGKSGVHAIYSTFGNDNIYNDLKNALFGSNNTVDGSAS